MRLSRDGDVVRAGNEARERFYDSRGYGRPVGGDVELAPVEAAHLLFRGDVDAVDGMDFRAFLSSGMVSEVDFLVYRDLRDRGFYLSPAREGWVEEPAGADFVVYPRGKGPWDGAVAHRVRSVGEREPVPVAGLGDRVLAVVDEESEVTYFATGRPDIEGTSASPPAAVTGELLADRAICWDPPAALYGSAFFGREFDDDAVQLSLVEAAYLARRGILDLDAGGEAVRDRGRELEGERFDRRLTAYAALRDAGVVPKTGFKFGADFRTYADVDDADDLGHAELLVRVVPADHTFAPRDLALDVRMAHGVRKTMVFALAAGGEVRWVSVERLTP